ncbi:MAG: 6-bladed beta-propeller [Bacteroidales bacterium]|nr:6-bladed beta-propeller [Bacteroidales bacterium]
MRYNNNATLLLAATLTLLSCKNKSSEGQSSSELKVFNLSVPESDLPKLNLSQLADSVSYVAMETNDDCLATLAVPGEGRIYSFSLAKENKEVACLDLNTGRFLHKIGRMGGSEEEFSELRQSNEDPVDHHFYVGLGCKIKCYDENGKYVKTIKHDYEQAGRFWVYNGLLYLYSEIYSKDTTQWALIDVESEKVLFEKKHPFHETFSLGHKVGLSLFENPSSGSIGDKYYYYQPSRDTVFCLQGKTVSAVCRIDIDGIHDKNGQINQSVFSKEGHYVSVASFEIFDSKLLAVCNYSDGENERCYYALLNLKDGTISYYDARIVNDLDGGPDILSLKSFYESLSVEDLKNDEEIYNSYFTPGVKAKLKDQEGKFQRILEPLEGDANPIIRIVHWKKDV